MGMRIVWHAEIVEGMAADLARLLNRLVAEGWAPVHVISNGINRWTVTASRAEAG